MVAAGAAALSSTVLAVVLSTWAVDPTVAGSMVRLSGIARAAAAALFLTSGILRLVRWRVLHEPRSGQMGCALMVLGGLCFPLTGLARALTSAEVVSLLSPLVRGAASVVCMSLVMRALIRTPSASGMRPVRVLVRAACVVLGMFAGLAAVQVDAPELLAGTDAAYVLIAGVLASGWFSLALLAALRAEELAWAGRLAPLLAAVGAAELLRSFDASTTGAWTLAALALCAAAGCLSAHSALLDLDEAISVGRDHREILAEALERAHEVATGHENWREEMTHDACNALAGLRGALQTLERYDGRLDGSTADRLRSAAIAEVRHLEHLILATTDAADRDFDVADVVATVVETRRAGGTRIQVWGGGHLHAHGSPELLATALQNLLVNAEVHAPGSPVVVHVSSGPVAVEIVVSDSGPGLTADEATQVFERGVRGCSSPGSGLGLHLARQAMRNQGGEVELLARQGGATFVLRLPASAHAAPRLPRQRSAPSTPVGHLQESA